MHTQIANTFLWLALTMSFTSVQWIDTTGHSKEFFLVATMRNLEVYWHNDYSGESYLRIIRTDKSGEVCPINFY